MSLPDSDSRDLKKAFSNLRLLTFLFIFFIFLISGTTVLVIATQTKENIISLTKDEIRSEAAIVALGIDGDALEQILPGDETSSPFIRIRDKLQLVKQSNPKILYIYTMRKTGNGIAFIVDGDYGISPDAGRIGQVYPHAFSDMLAGFYAPTADRDFVIDEWGSTLSGYAPIRNSRGTVVGIVGLDMDASAVTDRIKYLNAVFLLVGIISILAAVVGIIVIERRRSIDEELIVANKNYLNTIFESVQAGILIVDATTHRILDANPVALVLMGAKKDDVLDREHSHFIGNECENTPPFNDPKCDLRLTETVLLKTDGARIPIIRSVLPIVLDKKNCFLETFVDISERKKAEEDLLAAVRKLKVLSVVTRNDIISDIYALAGYLELLKEESPDLCNNPLTRKIDWVMERIREKSVFFRDYDEAGTKSPVWQEIESVVLASSARLKTTRLAITTDLDGLSVYADRLLYKVFDNLLDNTLRHAVEATRVRVTHHLMPDKSLMIVYTDNGPGVNPADRERIFERGVGEYTGLGLFLAREILSITDITIKENGKAGQGVRFEMTVPEGRYRLSPNTKDQDST